MVVPCSRIIAAQACSYGFWQSLPQINSFFSLLLCPTHPIFVLPLALFPPPFSFPGPFFLIDFARSSGQSVAQALERAWDQFPQNFKCSLGCQSGIICLQVYTTDHANIFCFVIGVLSVTASSRLKAKPAGRTTFSLIWVKTSKNCMFACQTIAFNLFALRFDMKIISIMWDYWEKYS